MDNFPGNSRQSKQVPPADKHVEKIIEGTARVRKKPMGRRFAETFFGGDSLADIGQALVFELVIPGLKDLLVEGGKQALERSFYPDGRSIQRARTRSGGGTGHVNYQGMYNGQPDRRQISNGARANHTFDEIVLDERYQAEAVLEKLNLLVDQYNQATVADLYELVGITAKPQDLRFGWTNLRQAGIDRLRGGGYLLDLPTPDVLK